MPMQSLSIPVRGDETLSGSLELPTGLVRGAAIFAHCFTCTQQSRAAVSVSRALAAEGIATLRFDFTGLGGSEGDFGKAGFATDIDDLVAVADHLSGMFDAPLLIVGHSLGGAACIGAASRLGSEKVAAVATIGAPSDVPHVLHNISGDLEAIESEGWGNVQIGGRPFKLSREFLESTRGVDLLDMVKDLRIPFLALHSPNDDIVSIDHAGALFQAAFHPKSFISLAGADHLLTDNADAQFAASMIANWARRYLPDGGGITLPETGVVSQTGNGKFGTEVHTAAHRFVADEPRLYGGDDTGPTPYDLLNAALGTCTAMTMKMYVDRKEWAFEGARVHVTHERDHAKDCDHCEEEGDGAKLQALNRSIEVLGDDLTEEQRAKLIEIADKCPVHKTLEGQLHIHTEAKL